MQPVGEQISREDGERMLAGIEAMPKAEAGFETEAETEAETEVEAAKAGAHHGVPHSAYATAHRKEMRNYHFRAGTTITNTAGTDFGAPNTYAPDKVEGTAADKRTVLHTISVDISTVVNGWVLVFHKTHVTHGHHTASLYSGDHTGWIRVRQLPEHARHAIAAFQHAERRRLAHGKGSGHRAPTTGARRTFDITRPETLTDDSFLVRGGGDTTSIGNYTHRPARYGDVIIGVWNPPGSGADGKRFGGSGGIRAFFPLDQKFHLTDVAPMHVADVTGTGTSTWRYLAATVGHDWVYCWVLERWHGPSGSGHNF
jgi:hypothetical protein